MSKEQSLKSNRAITLISLVITIIIMLILVGVTVQLVTDGKLISHSENAVNKTNDKVIQHQNRVNELTNILENIEQSQS